MNGPVSTLFIQDVVVGDRLGELQITVDAVTLFRLSAATWNAHRIHYDQEYARSEGYPDVLAQAHLLGSYLSRLVLDWGGPRSRLRHFRFENRSYAVVGDELTISGHVTEIRTCTDNGVVGVEIGAYQADGRLCAPGWASIELPRRFR